MKDPFAALLVTGGVVICRANPECFHARDRFPQRLKIHRYLKASEVGGQKCSVCGSLLAEKPAFLR